MDEEQRKRQELSLSAPDPDEEEDHEFNERFKLPLFQLHECLKKNLPQPVVNRCSLYSVVYNVNKAAYGKIESLDCKIQKKKKIEDHSPLVHAANNEHVDTSKEEEEEAPKVKLTVLDEEKFLLLIIKSRKENMDEDEEASSGSEAASFQSALPSPVKNQLWKPARSWWEAKSRKNPWLEPRNHIKRWWYLKPLIQYHKFLLKYIKKLKRSNINVQESSSPLCKFLCEEIHIISEHLSEVSKFSSEQWLEGLPHFCGWISQDHDSEGTIKMIAKSLPRKNFYVVKKHLSDISLPQKQIDEYFLEAISRLKNQIEDPGIERQVKKTQTYRKRSYNYPHVNRRYSEAHRLYYGHDGVDVCTINPYQAHLACSPRLAHNQSFYFQPCCSDFFYQTYYPIDYNSHHVYDPDIGYVSLSQSTESNSI